MGEIIKIHKDRQNMPAANSGVKGQTELHLRKRDVRWLVKAADVGGCPVEVCPTAFERLYRLRFIQLYGAGVARITPAGVDALAQLADRLERVS
jgi:hypothetical protein